MKYIWQQMEWPGFRYDTAELEDLLKEFSEKTGRVGGMLDSLPKDMQTDTIVDMIVSEAVETSAIEGEYISREDVMSSVRNNLGLNKFVKRVGDRRAEGIAGMMIAVREAWQEPLSRDMLFAWHNMLMKGSEHISSGEWRKHHEPMRVVSGPIGAETVHFEAPPSERIPAEMDRYIGWFNNTEPEGVDKISWPPIRTAIAHLYFETIHPFEDGNGRIGRAISEKALSQGLGRPALLSMSEAIEANRSDYYAALKQAQRSNEITDWIAWFTSTLISAQRHAEEKIDFTLKKTRFFDRVLEKVNDRQLKVLRRMAAAGPDGFAGGMSAKKYQSLTGASKSTATRDLRELVEKNALKSIGGGRSIRYHLDLRE